jgi:hypothetical protein
MVPQFCRLLGCFAIFWFPVIVYSFTTLFAAAFTSTNEAPFDLIMFCVLYSQHDTAFAILLFFAVLFFPMALLGVAVTGSFYAVNPISLATSVFRTFP